MKAPGFTSVTLASIASGNYHSCGLTAEGAAYCWGNNDGGRLGDNSTTTRLDPVVVNGGHVFRKLSAGGWHTCGITTAGAAYCWGKNGTVGRVGNNSSADSTVPAAIAIGTTFSDISVGREHACAIRASDGAAMCWGDNNAGQLGTNNTVVSKVPIAAVGPSGGSPLAFSSLSAGGYHTCGLTTSGVAYCWGGGWAGTIGNGANAQAWSPVAVSLPGGVTRFTSLSAGSEHVCALTATGTVYCWGYNANGQLGNGSTTNANTPTAIAAGAPLFASLAAGIEHTCGLTPAHVAYCWGKNAVGQLGIGTTTDSRSPAMVATSLTFQALASGQEHVCGLPTTESDVSCWGNNSVGQIGDGTTTSRTSPAATTFVSLTAGESHACGLAASGRVYCWGKNDRSQLGDGTTTTRWSPVEISQPNPILQFSKVAAGKNHTCGIGIGSAADYKAYCWGDNTYQKAGKPAGTATQNVFGAIATGTPTGGFGDISVGADHACAIARADKRAYCWGSNSSGRLGINTTATQSDGDFVLAPSGGTVLAFDSLSAGGAHTCGIAAGTTYCWGPNGLYQLGTTGNDRYLPGPIATPVGSASALALVDISVGMGFTCGRTAGGAGYCWGRNEAGQRGDGTTSGPAYPTSLASGSPLFTRIATGLGYHACGLTSAGAAYCWGTNNKGQLGNGTTTASTVPTQVNGGLTFTSISTGLDFTCGLTAAGLAYCWGDNTYGQLGDGTVTSRTLPQFTPTATPTPTDTPTASSSSDQAATTDPVARAPIAVAATPTSAPTKYLWTPNPEAEFISITSTNGFSRSVARAIFDPDTGERTFRGWLRNPSNGATYGVNEHGLLVWISPNDVALVSQVDWSNLPQLDVPPDAIDAIPMDTPAEGRLLWATTGTIYVVGADRQLHAIPDLQTFEARYVWGDVIPVSVAQVALLPVGPPVPRVE